MEKKVSVCMLCGNSVFSFYHRLRDDQTRRVGRCESCGHVQIIPLPSREEDAEYYQHNGQIRSVVSYSDLDDDQLFDKYKAIGEWEVRKAKERIKPEESVLELGSGHGWFVHLMRENGYSVDGIEISEERRAAAKERWGIILGDINLLDDSARDDSLIDRYDVIWMSHVLEHIIDPVFFLKRAARYLRNNGRIVVTVPNLHDYNKKATKEYDDFCYLRGHVAYYSSESLATLLKKCGFTDVSITGDQLYSVENAFYWMREKKPFPHYFQVSSPPEFTFLDGYYKRYLEENMLSYALVGTGVFAGNLKKGSL